MDHTWYVSLRCIDIIFNGFQTFRRPHLAGVRVIKPGQKVHASVAFIDKYSPNATLLKSEARIEWDRILGRGERDSIDWANGLETLLEMDLFDYLNAPMIIALAKSDIHNTFFIRRLEFMASFRTFGSMGTGISVVTYCNLSSGRSASDP
jgi:hypothetical protein